MPTLQSSFSKAPRHFLSSTLGRGRRSEAPGGGAPLLPAERPTDYYGFYVTLEEKAMEEAYLQRHAEKVATQQKWRKRLEKWDRKSDKKKKEYCRAGIPREMRPTVWPLLLNSYGWKFGRQEEYSELGARDAVEPVIYDIIERDLNRTFPTHQWFADPGGIGQQRLRRILRAYANFDPRVSYVQGMGFLAATLLLQIEDEESTFWALVALMKHPKYAMAELFAPGFPGLYMRLYQLECLMRRKCKKVQSRMVSYDVGTAIYATHWYLTLFSSCLNFALLSRIWDMFLCEGWKVIHRIAMAFLKLHEPVMMRSKDQCELLMALRCIQDDKDMDAVLKTALKVDFKTSQLIEWEKAFNKKEANTRH